MAAPLPDDPADFEPLPAPLPENPLELLPDDDLLPTLQTLRLVCGRNKSAFKTKNRKYICALWRALDAEKRRRPTLII